MIIKSIKNNKKGFSVIELMVAITILVVVVIVFYQVAAFSLRALKGSINETKAGYLAQEGVEAVRNIRDQVEWDDGGDGKIGIGEFSVVNIYYPIISANNWELTTTDPGILDIFFTREITFANLSRDPATDDIEDVYNPVNDDENSKKVTVKVSWQEGGENKDVTLVTYITNFK